VPECRAGPARQFFKPTHIDRDGLIWRCLSRSDLTIGIPSSRTKDDLTAALIGVKPDG